MKKRIERLRGMRDLLPAEYARQREVIERLVSYLALAGYSPVDAPVLEQSDLFHNSFGQELWQNLYAFRLHHRDLCMRPEYTASICRMYLDHFQQQPLPVRLQYAGPIFRYEAPGRSRYRQHTQLGVELFGGHVVLADAEILQLACDLLNELGITRYRVELGHIGIASGFINRLRLDDHAARLLLSLMEQISRSDKGEQAAQARLESLYPASAPGANADGDVLVDAANGQSAGNGPLEAETRVIASLMNSMSMPFNDETRQEIIDRYLWKMGRGEQGRLIQRALDFLRDLHAIAGCPPGVFAALGDLLKRYEIEPEELREVEQLVEVIQQCGVPGENIVVNLSLGRGVNYYTGLVFEIHAWDDEGFDTQLCGGGRYDKLIRLVGGSRDVNACGFAFGVDRLLSLLPPDELPLVNKIEALVIPLSAQEMAYAQRVARAARAGGMATEVDVTGRGVGTGLRLAAKRQARLALIVGEDERRAGLVTVRDLDVRGEQRLTIEQLVRSIMMKEQRL